MISGDSESEVVIKMPIWFRVIAWLGLMILFALVELIIDHILNLDFRNVQWAVVAYVMFFFGATGGMIGLAAQA